MSKYVLKMKTPALKFLLTASTAILSGFYALAQVTPEALLRENLDRAACHFHSYEYIPAAETPAPEGYKAFYVNHYGRHGSRRSTNWYAETGFLIGKDDSFYILNSALELIPTDMKYDPFQQKFLLVGDMFYYTFKISDKKGEMYYALRTGTFETVDTLYREYPEDTSIPRLHFTSQNDKYVRPRISL